MNNAKLSHLPAKRTINFRPLFYGCLAFGIGISFAYYLFNLSIAHITFCVIGFLACLLFAIFKKAFINFIVIIACFGAGLFAYSVDAHNFTAQKYSGEVCMVEGRIGTKIYPSDATTFLVLEDVSYSGESGSNLALNIVTAGSDLEFETGMIIRFTAEIYDEFVFENQEFNSFAYKMSAPHSASVDGVDIEILQSGQLTFAESVRLYVKNLLHKYMPYETAELSYSILFGDQTKLDEKIKNNFSTSGLGHLVAVSGLNTAVLVAFLYWLLKLFRTPRIWRFVVVSIILVFYCYLCSFAPSVVRASIMSLAFLGFTLLGKQYDLLSSLGFAGFIILICSPLAVFDAGFLMSFVSVMSIGILVDPLTKFFNKKCKLPQSLSGALAIDVCTTLAISPILAIYFGKISFFSWLTNLICVPIFSFAYILVFALVFVVSILPFMNFLLTIPSLLLQFVIWFAGIIAGLKFAIINLYNLTFFGTITFFLVLFIFGKMFMGSASKRLTCASICIVCSVVMTLGFAMPASITKTTYTQLNTYLPSAVVTSSSGEVLVLTDGSNLTYVDRYLMSKNITQVSALVLTGVSEESQFAIKYTVKTILHNSDDFVFVGDFAIKYISLNSLTKAIYLKIDDVGILVGVNRIGAMQAETLKAMLNPLKIDAIYETKSNQNFTLVKDVDYVFSRDKLNVNNNYATKVCGAFTFEITSGIIGEIRSKN